MSITISLGGVDYEIPSPGESDNFADAFNAYLVALAAAVAAADAPEAWVAPTFATGWSDNNVVGFSKQSASGRVNFKGSGVRDATGSTTIFTLPVGYRPSQLMVFPVAASYTDDLINPFIGITGATLNIGTDGTVVLNLNLASHTSMGAAATIARLDGLSFLTL